MRIFDNNDVRELNEGETYKNKYLIISKDYYVKSFQNSRNQLFFAAGGIGCDPENKKARIYGKVWDDKMSVPCEYILGIAKDEAIKEWEEDYDMERYDLLPDRFKNLKNEIEAADKEGYDETDIVDICLEKGYTISDFFVIDCGEWAKQVAEENGLIDEEDEEISNETISKQDVLLCIDSYIHEIITESGTDKNEHTNKILRMIIKDIKSM